MSEGHRLSHLRDRGSPAQPLLLVRDLKKYFPAKRHLLAGRREMVQAVDGVSFSVMKAPRSASSANPAAANRRPRGSCCI